MFLKSSLLYGLANFLPRIVLIVLIPFITNNYSVGEYGIFDFSLSILQILTLVVGLGLDRSVIRYYTTYSDSEKKIFIWTLLFIDIIVSIIFVFVYLTATEQITLLFFKNIVYVNIIFILIILALLKSLFRLLTTIFRINKEAKKYLFINFFVSLIIILVSVLSIIFYKIRLEVIFILQVVIYLLFLLFLLRSKISLKNMKFSKVIAKRSLQFSIPLILTSLSWLIIRTIDRFYIVHTLGTAQLGIYSLAVRISSIVTLIGVAPFQLAFAPQVFSIKDENKKLEEIIRLGKKFFFLLLNFCIIIGISVKVIVLILANNDYSESGFYSLLMLPAIFLAGIYFIVAMIYQVREKTKLIFFVVFAISLLTIIIDYYLILYFNIYGAVIADLLENGAIFLLLYKLRTKVINEFLFFDNNLIKIIISFFIVFIIQVISFDSKYFELLNLVSYGFLIFLMIKFQMIDYNEYYLMIKRLFK